MPIIYNIVVALVVFIHSRLSFELVSKIFNKSKYHFLQYFFCAINALLSFFVLEYLHEFTSIHCIVLLLILYIQIKIIFIAKYLEVVVPASILLVHLFVIRAVVVSVVALVNNAEIMYVISDPFLFWLTSLLTFSLHGIANVAFYTFTPEKNLRIMKNSTEIVMFFFAIGVLLISYMIYNAGFYKLDNQTTGINIQQIVLPLTLLSIFYLSLLMLIRIVNLHFYQEKATKLEDTITREKGIKSALFNMTKIFVEFNCSTDELKRLVIYEKDSDTSNFTSYSDFLFRTSSKFMHPDDVHKSVQAQASNIIELANKGIFEVTYEYRSPVKRGDRSSDKNYLWHKFLLQSKIDKETGEVMAFFLIYEIHDQKEIALALKDKAEKDTLTGGLNRDAAKSYIGEHLETKPEGTFFVIDLDNFKPINDNFGHSYGDAVLCSIYDEIRCHFRSHDIIARIGGDEFIVFTPDRLSVESLKTKANDINLSIHKSFTTESKKTITLSASIGISHAPEDGRTFQKLFDAADKAMYNAKNSGKNAFSIYTREI